MAIDAFKNAADASYASVTAKSLMSQGMNAQDLLKQFTEAVTKSVGANPAQTAMNRGSAMANLDAYKLNIPNIENNMRGEARKLSTSFGTIFGESAKKSSEAALRAGTYSMTAMFQGYANMASVATMKMMQSWQTTWQGGIWGMHQVIATNITDAFTALNPVVGKAVGMFSGMMITSMKSLFDWNIAQNKLNISTMAMTGKSSGMRGGSFLGMNVADTQAWASAAMAGGSTGAEKTGEVQRGTARVLDKAAWSSGAQNIMGGADALDTAMSHIKMKTIKTLHEVNVGEELFRAGTSMGLDAGATGALFKQMQMATGNTANSIKEMGQLFEGTTDAARRTGIAGNIFRDAIMGASASARLTNTDMKSVNNTMTMLSKSRVSMGALGIDLASQGGDILKNLTDRSKMSAAQHANLGMEMAGGLGISPSSTMQAYAMSRYGTKVAQGLQYTGNEIGVAGVNTGDQKNAFQNLKGDVNAESLKAMRASAFAETAHISDASERLFAQQQLMKTKYGLEEPAATALLTTSEKDVGDLSKQTDFQNSMKSAQQLAAQTLSAAQRQEAIQRKLVDIAANLTAIIVAGLLKLGSYLIPMALGINTLAKRVVGGEGYLGGAKGESKLAEMAAIGQNVDFGKTVGDATANIAQDTLDIVNLSGGMAGFDKMTAKNIQYTNQQGPKVGTRHTGGMLDNYAIVQNSEAFTFNPSANKFHSGGMYGGMSGLKDDEVFMMSNKPVGVQTESQFKKSNGSNGPIYNMSFTISGVASKGDIVNTFQKAINEALG